MHIEKFLTTIQACRFCFMCRHLSPIGNVTFRESDTPRGRALMLDKVIRSPELLENPDVQSVLYDAELSAACRTHCVSHFDEAGLILAARRDAVERNCVPENIRKIADDMASAQLIKEGDPGAEVVYYVDAYTERYQPEIAVAMQQLLSESGISFRTLSGIDSGKSLTVLGFHEKAKMVAADIVAALQGGKILVTSCPAAYDAFKNDYMGLGVPLNIEILHSSELILQLLRSKQITLPFSLPSTAFFLPSDYLRNYNNHMDAPDQLIKTLGISVLPFGNNTEESYTAGEGAVIYDCINPRLTALLVARIEENVDNPEQDILLTASPYTKFVLRKYGTRSLKVFSIEEIAATGIK